MGLCGDREYGILVLKNSEKCQKMEILLIFLKAKMKNIIHIFCLPNKNMLYVIKRKIIGKALRKKIEIIPWALIKTNILYQHSNAQ